MVVLMSYGGAELLKRQCVHNMVQIISELYKPKHFLEARAQTISVTFSFQSGQGAENPLFLVSAVAIKEVLDQALPYAQCGSMANYENISSPWAIMP